MNNSQMDTIIQVYANMKKYVENNNINEFENEANMFCNLLGFKDSVPLDNNKDLRRNFAELKKGIFDNSNDEIKSIIAILDALFNNGYDFDYFYERINNYDYLLELLHNLNNEQALLCINSIRQNANSIRLSHDYFYRNNPEQQKTANFILELEAKIVEQINHDNEIQQEQEKDNAVLAEFKENTNIDFPEYVKLIKQLSSDDTKNYVIKNYLDNFISKFYNPDNLEGLTPFLSDINYIIRLVNDDLKLFIILHTYENPQISKMIEESFIWRRKINDNNNVSKDVYKSQAYCSFDDIAIPFRYFKENGMYNELKNLQNEDNIDYLLSLYGYDENTKNYLTQLMSFDEKLLKYYDFRLLDRKYTDLFPPKIMYKIWKSSINLAEFSDKYLQFIDFIVNYLLNNEELYFDKYFCYIMQNIYKGNCDDLILNNDLSSLTKEQIDNLLLVLINNNAINAKNTDDLNNLENCIRQNVVFADNERDIDKLKNAVLLKKYGLSLTAAKRTWNNYKELLKNDPNYAEIETIINLSGSPDYYYQSVEILYNIFMSCDYSKLLDVVKFEKQCSMMFETEYNNNLVGISKMKQINNDDGIPVFDAGDDFKMLIHAKGAYHRKSLHDLQKYDNVFEDWNRSDLSSSILCCSLISDEMLGMCNSENGIYFGFDHIESGSLINMGTTDIESYSDVNGADARGHISFEKPDELINKTGYPNLRRSDRYNEININRIGKNGKIQPSYVIAFKTDGEIKNYGIAKKTSQDFNNIPIVILDVDRLLLRGIEEINRLSLEYEMNPTTEGLNELWNKFHNYSVTYSRWKYDKDNQKPFHEIVKLPKIILDNMKMDDLMGLYSIGNDELRNELAKEQEIKVL